MRRSLLAAVMLVTAASSAACHTTRHPATTTPAASITPKPSLACAGSGVRVVSTSPVTTQHSAAEAIGTLQLPPGSRIVGATAALATTPLATKLGLGSRPLVLWLIRVDDKLPAHGGPVAVPPHTGPYLPTLHTVVDADLRLAGAFTCR